MLNFLQIVTTPTADTPGTCLMLHFDDQRYVFGNISEGTQRAMVQRKVALNKTGDIFMTGQVNWHTAGGLIGMILTLADVIATQKEDRKKKGLPEPESGTLTNLRIHGGKNLNQFLATARRFVFRKGLPLRPKEICNDPRATEATKSNATPDWQDANINVWYMPVEAEPKSSRKRSHEEMFREELSEEKQHSTEEQDQQVVSEIVTQMFDSSWKLDTLVETTLYKAKLPAKLFYRDERGKIAVYRGPLPGEADNVPDIPVLVRQPWPAARVLSLPPTKPSRKSMCYIVKGHDRRGKFNVQEAQKYQIQKSDYKVLARGDDVVAADGTRVTAEMVLGPTVKGLGFAVLDVPEASYIEPLINRPEWANEEILEGIKVVYWLLAPGLASDPRLQAFIEKFKSLRHVICSGDTAPNMLALESAAAQTYKLHQIDPDRFPLPCYSNAETLSGSTTVLGEPIEVGKTGKTVQFSPRYLHQDDKILAFPDIPTLAKKNEVPESELLPLIEKARQKCSDPDFLAKVEQVEADIPNRDAEVITLGTGSALPSKYRNVSATLVRVPGYGNYLFDAGENTLGQLRRTFGNELPSVLQDLKVIWISHLHADHHLGTASVVKAWHRATEASKPSATLHIASHVDMIKWLREYSEIEDYGWNRLAFTSISPCNFKTKICEIPALTPKEQEASGLERIDACYVEHCFGALATVFTWPSGLKIAYSGDCRPSDAFVQIGQGTTLLIHESTFDDELKGDAIAKKHSTMSEAIDVGRRMGARRIMLTHFSQRYQKIPALDETLEIKVDGQVDGREKAKLDEVILVAFDYMRAKLGDFRKAQAFLPSIQRLLGDAEE
ncbi:hypothetical protein LQW54_008585 [Pestalotiopsis sp. IQ-011]